MSPMEKVMERYSQAFSIHHPWGWEIIAPCDQKPSPGYKAHKCLGAGSTPKLAWCDAAQRFLRRGKRRATTSREQQVSSTGDENV